jgi:putative transposase
MPQKRPRRLGNVIYQGRREYFLTFCTYQRRHLFTDQALIKVVAAQIVRAARVGGFDLIAYCFMPDHFHVLATGNDDSAALKPFVSRAKQLSAYHGRRVARAKIWQEGFYERIVREGELVDGLVRYILENPVRARLVAHPRDYPFIGSTVYSRDQLMAFLLE